MLELLYMTLIVELIEGNIDITLLPQDKLNTMLRLQANTSIDRRMLDYKIKCLLDRLSQKYGYIGSLVAIDRLKRSTWTLRNKISEEPLNFNLYLLTAACTNLYERLEIYYLIDIIYKLYNYFRKLKNGTFDEVEFFATITQEKLKIPYIEEEEDLQQSLDNFDTGQQDAEIEGLKKLFAAISLRERAFSRIKKSIQTDYTREEISTYIMTLIDLLAVNLNEEYMVVTKALCQAGNFLSDYTRPKKRVNPKQTKMPRF